MPNRDGGKIEIWGDGLQTRSFLYIDECIEAVRRLMESTFPGPVNIGSEEMVTINQMAEMIMRIAGKKLAIKHISGPTGVRGSNSDNNFLVRNLTGPHAESLRGSFEDISVDREPAQGVSRRGEGDCGQSLTLYGDVVRSLW